ncbi:MAG: polysaccharide biosynthesis/export family protein [Acidobacteriota bacterium]|nr:polysaccharide biosynthesis/export family protein [Acidobacteriota bacterium]
MKRGFFLCAGLILCLALPAPAQTSNTRVGPVDNAATQNGDGDAKEERKAGSRDAASEKSDPSAPVEAGQSEVAPARATASNATITPVPKSESKPAVKTGETATTNAPAAAAPSAAAPPLPPTAIYRVGAGDVLDIRLLNSVSRDSTLYTVSAGGLLEYPPAGDPFMVAGMTTDEIANSLAAELKRRALNEQAQFRVSVREYVSHTAMVSGLVDQPGRKILRREAVPLYVVLAEALPRADAGRAMLLSRSSGQSKSIDLSDSLALNELVSAGDVINVLPPQPEFFYIGGKVKEPGQKNFHAGLTLTQAILASGGVDDGGDKVKVVVSRQGADGRLISTEYLLKEIEEGQVPDPKVQPGDRVEVGRRR